MASNAQPPSAAPHLVTQSSSGAAEPTPNQPTRPVSNQSHASQANQQSKQPASLTHTHARARARTQTKIVWRLNCQYGWTTTHLSHIALSRRHDVLVKNTFWQNLLVGEPYSSCCFYICSHRIWFTLNKLGSISSDAKHIIPHAPRPLSASSSTRVGKIADEGWIRTSDRCSPSVK